MKTDAEDTASAVAHDGGAPSSWSRSYFVVSMAAMTKSRDAEPS